ncbi:RNA ligase [Halopiger aswanensis]|uniref:Putative ATP-dependent DNA ligase n=1 Tax=Halopiger aswanensis TaxID=148449 RepID=A0A419WIF2_9EURY|nr:RNA ligase [Halopiger aswanensis]RKD95226.1 putative ATP-dependent DNA ligase [Halopiger aswanensis]
MTDTGADADGEERTEYHTLLGIGAEAFESLEPHLETRSYEDREYRHVPDYRRGVERGTTLLEGTVVRGFPKVPRTLVLEEGIPEQFGDREEIAVEEKLNGYNVRVARVDGEVLAFSRSGMICPFTTRILDRLVDLEPLFDEYPAAMVCGEMIGPENPYTAHDYPDVESIAFRAFDWRDRESGEPLPVRERRERYERFDVPQTPLLGIYAVDEAADEVRELIADLNERGREGVVMKSPDGDVQLKYTTSAANRGDLAYAFSFPFDYGQPFMFRRLIREAFQSVEWGESDEQARERAHDLGEAILLSMRDTVETVADGDRVGERHTVRASSDTIDVLFEHLRGQGLDIEIEDDRREDGDRVVTFRKRTQSTNDKTRNYLEGQIVRE